MGIPESFPIGQAQKRPNGEEHPGKPRKFDPELKGATLVRYLQTPFVTIDTLEEAAETLAMGDADAATGVEEIHGDVFRRSPHGLEILRLEAQVEQRQRRERVLRRRVRIGSCRGAQGTFL